MTDADGSASLHFGDLLARARQAWIRQMAVELAARGFPDYRRSDAIAVRVLRRGPRSLGELSQRLGVSRQVARQVADGLHARGFVTLTRTDVDRRRVEVRFTDTGELYAEAVVAVVRELNDRISSTVDAAAMATARAVLQSVAEAMQTGTGELSEVAGS